MNIIIQAQLMNTNAILAHFELTGTGTEESGKDAWQGWKTEHSMLTDTDKWECVLHLRFEFGKR